MNNKKNLIIGFLVGFFVISLILLNNWSNKKIGTSVGDFIKKYEQGNNVDISHNIYGVKCEGFIFKTCTIGDFKIKNNYLKIEAKEIKLKTDLFSILNNKIDFNFFIKEINVLDDKFGFFKEIPMGLIKINNSNISGFVELEKENDVYKKINLEKIKIDNEIMSLKMDLVVSNFNLEDNKSIYKENQNLIKKMNFSLLLKDNFETVLYEVYKEKESKKLNNMLYTNILQVSNKDRSLDFQEIIEVTGIVLNMIAKNPNLSSEIKEKIIEIFNNKINSIEVNMIFKDNINLNNLLNELMLNSVNKKIEFDTKYEFKTK